MIRGRPPKDCFLSSVTRQPVGSLTLGKLVNKTVQYKQVCCIVYVLFMQVGFPSYVNTEIFLWDGSEGAQWSEISVDKVYISQEWRGKSLWILKSAATDDDEDKEACRAHLQVCITHSLRKNRTDSVRKALCTRIWLQCSCCSLLLWFFKNCPYSTRSSLFWKSIIAPFSEVLCCVVDITSEGKYFKGEKSTIFVAVSISSLYVTNVCTRIHTFFWLFSRQTRFTGSLWQ